MNRKQIAKYVHDYIYYYYALHQGKRPIVVGLSAPQGCGKTTLTRALKEQFTAEGLKSVVISLDDFYLPRAEQVKLAEESGNELLKYRGNAGTHDIALLEQTLTSLASCSTSSQHSEGRGAVLIPAFNKSLCQGLGDQMPRSQWEVIKEGVDIVILEGWMLGFHSISADSATTTVTACAIAATASVTDSAVLADVLAHCPAYAQVNQNMERYSKAWSLIDLWLVLGLNDYAKLLLSSSPAEAPVTEPSTSILQEQQDGRINSSYSAQHSVLEKVIYSWRLEAEHRMIAELQEEATASAGAISGNNSIGGLSAGASVQGQVQQNQQLQLQGGLSDAQVRDFVSRFLPAYIACLGSIYKEGPRGRKARPVEYQGHTFVGEGRGQSETASVPISVVNSQQKLVDGSVSSDSPSTSGMGSLAPVLLMQVNSTREVVSICELI